MGKIKRLIVAVVILVVIVVMVLRGCPRIRRSEGGKLWMGFAKILDTSEEV